MRQLDSGQPDPEPAHGTAHTPGAQSGSDEPSPGLFPEGFTLRDEANAIVAWAFRNGPIETLHAGTHSPLLEDPSLSRITDAEMRELMLAACRMMEKILRLKASDPQEYARQIQGFRDSYCRAWER